MGKKLKPVSVNDVEIDTTATQADIKNAESVTSAPTVDLDKPITADVALNSTASESEMIAALEKTNQELVRENDELKERITGYLEEIDRLKNAAVKTETVPKNSAEMQALIDENDSYLMKISELTFENAKLKAQAKNPPKCPSPVVPSHREIPNKIGFGRPNRNGYSDWN